MTTRADQGRREQRLAELRARRAMSRMAVGRRTSRTKPKVSLFPRGARLEYQRALIAIIDNAAERIRKEILPKVASLAEQTRQNDPSMRVDAPADEIGDLFDELLTSELAATERTIGLTASTVVRRTAEFNANDQGKVIESVLDVGLPPTEPFLDGFIVAATKENVGRITGLSTTQIKEAENIILSGFRRGKRIETLGKELEKRFKINRNRARLIARDQVASINGELTRLRQTNLGVERYIWRTTSPEPRDTHEARDGEIFTWAAGSEEGTHPGEEINCLCYAEAVLTDLIDVTEPSVI